MKYLFYLLIVCVFAANAQEFLLFEMIHPKNFLFKFIPDVPYIVWSILATICTVTFISMAWTKIRYIKDSYKPLWQSLIGFLILEGVFDILATALPENKAIGITGFVIVILTIILTAFLGYKLSKAYKGKIKMLGYVFTYIPAIFLVLTFIIFALLPDGYGDINMSRFENRYIVKEEYFYSDSTILWTWVLVIINALTDIIVVGACLTVIDSELDEELSDKELPQQENNVQAPAEEKEKITPVSLPDATSQDHEIKKSGKNNNKKSWIIVTIVLILAGATTLIVQLVSTHKSETVESGKISNDKYAEIVLPWGVKITLKADHTIPELSPEASWEIKDDALLIFSGEGTTYWTIIGEYLYEGYYEDGLYWVQEWDTETKCFVDEGFPPMPSMGEKLKSIKIYGDRSSSNNRATQEDNENISVSKEIRLTPYSGSANYLAPQAGNTYVASNLTDNNLSTGWAVNLVDEGYENHEVFGPSLALDPVKSIDYITINNGYGKSKESFNNNTRAGWIQIYRIIPPDTGFPEQQDILYEGPLKDTNETQRLEINRNFNSSEPTNVIKLKFSDKNRDAYYYGDKFKDLVISEIKVYGH